MYKTQYTGQFKRDLKRIKKRSPQDLNSLRKIVEILQEGGRRNLPEKHRTHLLSGTLAQHWECHILPDLLLIWLQNDSTKLIVLVRAGSHADLF